MKLVSSPKELHNLLSYICSLQCKVSQTFSETRLLLPFNSSGAIHGKVPRTPPDTRVLRLILDNPKSPTWKSSRLALHRQIVEQQTMNHTTNYLAYGPLRIPQIDKQIVTLQIKMNDIFKMQVFHAKSCIQRNYKFSTTIK